MDDVSKGKRVCDKGPDGGWVWAQELREGGFCCGGSAARKTINHYLGHETDVTDYLCEGGKEEWGKREWKREKEGNGGKPSFALGGAGQDEKAKRERDKREKEGSAGGLASAREGERGLPGAAIGPSAVMAGAEKPTRRPLMEAGMLKLRVVVSTPSPGTAVRPLPLELSLDF